MVCLLGFKRYLTKKNWSQNTCDRQAGARAFIYQKTKSLGFAEKNISQDIGKCLGN